MINILIVEDNNELRRLMKIRLARAGYSTFEAGDGAEALEMMEHNAIHLLIVDIMMPRKNGFELTEELRNAGITVPVIIISARETLEDKREGFSRGADDYMTKPVDMEELILRVEALLRRCNISETNILRVGECVLNVETLILSRKDEKIDLRLKECNLLHKLLSYPNKIFTRQNLMDEIWGYDSESDPRTVDTHIKRLREKLSDIPEFEIITVRGLGYKAELKV